MRNKAEVHIVISPEGVTAVQIIGTAETHREGHGLYFAIQDLVIEFDKSIQNRIRGQNTGEKSGKH